MEWIDYQHQPIRRASVLDTLAQKAARQHPDSPWSILANANSAFAKRDYAAALDRFEAIIDSEIEAHIPWDKVSQCYLELGQAARAWGACERGFAFSDAPAYPLSIQAGIVQTVLKDEEQARHHFLAAAHAGNVPQACWHILMEFARKQDAPALLRHCDDLEATFGPSSVFRANRAIAYSILGETDKAAELVDLEAHVCTGPISEFPDRDLGAFNAQIGEEALAIAAGAGSWEKTIVPHADISGSPTMRELQSLICNAIEDYLAEAQERGLDKCLPLPLEKATLSIGATLLRGNASNGQHIHLTSIISAVYHLGNPADDAGMPEAGSLQIGPVDQYAGGHRACWGERRILPKAGQLTIFPAHFYHDVIPTRSRKLRISIPADVHPIA